MRHTASGVNAGRPEAAELRRGSARPAAVHPSTRSRSGGSATRMALMPVQQIIAEAPRCDQSREVACVVDATTRTFNRTFCVPPTR